MRNQSWNSTEGRPSILIDNLVEMLTFCVQRSYLQLFSDLSTKKKKNQRYIYEIIIASNDA